MNKVTIIAAMHGDEVYGIELYDHFTKKYPSLSSSVQLIIGNKLAYEKNVRFIDASTKVRFENINDYLRKFGYRCQGKYNWTDTYHFCDSGVSFG